MRGEDYKELHDEGKLPESISSFLEGSTEQPSSFDHENARLGDEFNSFSDESSFCEDYMGSRERRESSGRNSNRLGLLARLGRGVWIAFCVMIALGVIAAGNGGMINPERWTFPSILALTFPVWLIVNLICGIINAFCFRKLALVNAVGLLLTLQPTWAFCPLNFGSGRLSEEQQEHSFKFMTYNTFSFKDYEDFYPNGTNRTASAIINSDADIVCLQEVGRVRDLPNFNLYSLQVDSINSLYPYSLEATNNMATILSKYPLTSISVPQPDSNYSNFSAAEVVINGDTILVFSVHLESLGLSDRDKTLYISMTEGEDKKEWMSGGKIIYRKLAHAFRQRAAQAKMLTEIIDSLDYKTVIVAGDFNDIADCYAIRTLKKIGLKSSFSEAGFGPRITYHDDRFYFNIDHVLFRGNLRAVSTSRGHVCSSDHYPVFCTFLIEPN